MIILYTEIWYQMETLSEKQKEWKKGGIGGVEHYMRSSFYNDLF